MIRRLVAPVLSVLLIIGVGVAIYVSVQEQQLMGHQQPVKGLSGSEKLPFFKDSETISLLSEEPHFLHVDVEKAGSRQIATSFNLAEYDFAFPAGVPAAEKIRREHKVSKSFQPFFTPMVIASWKPIAEILIANGIVKQRDNAYYIVDMNKLFQLIISKTRWNELQNSDAYPANKSILVTTTDIRKSNSAAMYLALSSYVLNGNTIVQNEAQADKIIKQLAELFLRQGFTENSSAVPFQDYLTMGPGKTPMVMMYEAQFLHEAMKPNSAIRKDMLLLYPEPTLFTKHVLLSMTEAGSKLGEALLNDEKIHSVATKHGLRTENIGMFRQLVQEKQLKVPDMLVNIIEPPSYEVLEAMIQKIETYYQNNQVN